MPSTSQNIASSTHVLNFFQVTSLTSAAASGAPLTDGVTHTTIDNPDQNDKARAYINRLSEVAGATIVQQETKTTYWELYWITHLPVFCRSNMRRCMRRLKSTLAAEVFLYTSAILERWYLFYRCQASVINHHFLPICQQI